MDVTKKELYLAAIAGLCAKYDPDAYYTKASGEHVTSGSLMILRMAEEMVDKLSTDEPEPCKQRWETKPAPQPHSPPKSDIDWDSVDLGERTDVEIARELCVRASTVMKQRHKRDIPTFGVDWDSVDFGERTDTEIAKEIGMSSAAVKYQRRKRRIPGARRSYGPSSSSSSSIDWDSVGLGKVSDQKIADRLGVSKATVWEHRTKMGIPATFHNRGRPPANKSVPWDSVRFGVLSDRELAERLGVTSGAVRYQRVKRGIPPAPLNLQPPGASK